MLKGLSRKEVEVISELEYGKRYYFQREDIIHHFDSDSKMRNTIHKLISKGRIVSLNRNKYRLIPIKAKEGAWSEDPYKLADEIMDSTDYLIGGWAAANYWRLTDQVPMKIEIFTTKRQGLRKILGTTFIFRRTTRKRIMRAVKADGFMIQNLKETKDWMRSRI